MADSKQPAEIPITAEELEQYPGEGDVVAMVEDRIRRAAAGERIPGCGPTYGEVVSPKSQEELLREVGTINFLRGVEQERERCAKIADEHERACEPLSGTPGNDGWKLAVGAARGIAARIRSGE